MGMEMEMEMEMILQKGECSYNKGKGVARDVDDAVKHGTYVVLDVDSMVDLMGKKLDFTRGKPSYRSTIFKIPPHIRFYDDGYGADAAYTPKVVSIGLLQHGGRSLDEHKWHYLDEVLSRSKNANNMNLKKYTKEMANIVVEAAFCYSGRLRYEPGGKLESRLKDYVKIMLVDGCFLINLLLQLEDGSVEINDPIYSDRWTLPWVGHDMLLLENQLPFFVLEKLWELTGRERPALKKNVLRFFRNLLPDEHDLELPEKEDVHHLLHLIHLSLRPASSSKKPSTGGTTIPRPPQPGDTPSSTMNSSSESPKPLQSASATEKPESASGATTPRPDPQLSDTLSTSKSSPFRSSESLQPTSSSRIWIDVQTREPFPPPPWSPRQMLESALSPHDEFPIGSDLLQIPSGLEQFQGAQQIIQMSEPRPAPPPKTIPSATELQNAGVKFQIKKARSFLDVTFEPGLMQMPRLTISDSTNSLFRNFIAFEQGYPDCGSHFTSYCIFMDSLINTARDVEILKRAGIIEHVLGSDEEVASLFNKLCKGTTWDFKNSYLAKVFEDVIKYSKKSWPEWRAKLVRDYFSNPWTIISLAAAIFVIILAFVQTFLAVFAYFRPPRS